MAAVRVPPSACKTSQSIPTLALAETFHVGNGPQAAPDETLDFLRTARRKRSFSIVSGIGGAGQHAVLSRHPAATTIAHERRHRIFDTGRAGYMRVAKLSEAGPFRIFREISFQNDIAQLICVSAGRAHKRTFFVILPAS